MRLRSFAQLALLFCAATLGCNSVKEYTADYSAPTALLTAPPTFDPPAGSYTVDQNVVLTSTTDGASIYYTIDGTAPDQTATAYTGPVSVQGNGNWTVRAVALASNHKVSDITAASYSIAYAAAQAPVFDPNGGLYHADQNVVLTSATDGATIYYTTDGTSSGSRSETYTGPIAVRGSGTVTQIRALATAPMHADSAISSADYNIVYPVAATPSLSANLLDCNTLRAMSTATVNGNIFYTTDGTEPNNTSALYTGPIALQSGTLKAITIAAGYQPSAVASLDYAVTQNVYVSATNGNDGLATGSATAPFATVSAALQQVSSGNACFSQILLEQGDYALPTTLALDANVALLGGYDSAWARNSVANPTRLLDASTPSGLLLDMQATANANTCISGLTLVGQSITGTDSVVLAIEGGNGIVANNNIVVQGAGDARHTAIHVVDGTPQIVANHLHVSQAAQAFGILIDNGSPLIFSNTIDTTATATTYNYGIAHGGVGLPIISNNTIGFGHASVCTGIGYNNSTQSAPYIENNIVWADDIGQTPICIFASAYTSLKNNDLFRCAGGLVYLSGSNTSVPDAMSVNGLAHASGNLSFVLLTGTNTFFVDETDDWHLQTGLSGNFSMVKDGGLLGGEAAAAYGVDFDLDGQARASSGGWTMGAYELHN